MSAENVEVVRSACEAFGRGDLEGLDQYVAEDAEWETPDSLPLGAIVRGRGAILGNFAQLPQYRSKFSVDPDEFSVDPDEFTDAGDQVVVRGVQRVTGAGGSSESRSPHLFKLSEGTVVRGRYLSDSLKCEEALGS
jgi:uncharacterized protein